MQSTLLLAGLALLFSACAASITNIHYTPQPSRIANPAADVKLLIQANTVANCTTTPEVQSLLIVVQSTCTGQEDSVEIVENRPYVTTGSAVVRLDHVESIKLQKSGVWFGMFVHHNNGANDFVWTSKSLEDMERLADAITALAKPPPSPHNIVPARALSEP